MTETREAFAKADKAFAEIQEKPAAYWFGGDGEDTADVRDVAYLVRGDGQVVAVNVEAHLQGLEDADGVVYLDCNEYTVSTHVLGGRHLTGSLEDVEVFDEVTAHYAAEMPSWYTPN